MNRLPRSTALLSALTLSLLCAACGGGGGDAPAVQPATPTPPVVTPPAVTPPAIATGPANQSVVVGSSATFSVVASGTAPLTYQWQRNGVDVAGATAATYVLPAAALGDTRTSWHAVVRNSAGSATSADATLSVNGIGLLAGAPGESGYVDGSATNARFGGVSGLALGVGSIVYVADPANGAVRAIAPSGTVTTLLGGLAEPSAVAVDAAGNVFVAEKGNGQIRKITSAGVASIIATVPPCGGRGYLQYQPSGITADGAGGAYVVTGLSIRRIDSSGAITFIAGSDACNPFDNTASYIPRGIVRDNAGNLYVGRYTAIDKITPAGVVTPFVTGLPESPASLAIDAQGNLYATEYTERVVRKVTPAGVVSIVAGVVGNNVTQLGALPGALAYPDGVAVDSFGNLYVGVSGAVLKIQFP